MKRQSTNSVSKNLGCKPRTINNNPGRLTLLQIVRDYNSKYKDSVYNELEQFQQANSLNAVIETAGKAIDFNGKRFGHQWRLTDNALSLALSELKKSSKKINACKNFDELLSLVESTAGSVYGIGELYNYDTALRIGAYQGLFPEQVYLHRGVREGARKLGLDTRRRSIPIEEFPIEFRMIDAKDLEDIVCIYKDHF